MNEEFKSQVKEPGSGNKKVRNDSVTYRLRKRHFTRAINQKKIDLKRKSYVEIQSFEMKENTIGIPKTYRLIDRKHQVRNNACDTEQNDFKTPHCWFEFGKIPLETNTLSTKEYNKRSVIFQTHSATQTF